MYVKVCIDPRFLCIHWCKYDICTCWFFWRVHFPPFVRFCGAVGCSLFAMISLFKLSPVIKAATLHKPVVGGRFLYSMIGLFKQLFRWSPWFVAYQLCTGSEPLLKEVCSLMDIHLVAYQTLASQTELRGLFLYKVRPKHHYVQHMMDDLKRNLVNPRVAASCWSDGSFLGRLKRIGVQCHERNMADRLFQRYILYLSLRWRDSRGP